MNVLISAYACEPGRGSEPGVGWNMVRHLSRHHRLWVLTRANNEPAIRAALESDPLPNVEWVFIDLPPHLRWWKRGQRGVQLYYYLWQRLAGRTARALAEEIQFDVAHHVTFVKYWTASYIHGSAPVFVWGPVGGGERTPAPFMSTYSLRGRVYEAMRAAARWLAERDPALARTARAATIALVTTEETGARVRALGAHTVQQQWESGLSQDEYAALACEPGNRPAPRFLCSGRLLHLKGFALGLQAFARAGVEGAEYWILGDGPERERLEMLTAELGIADRVTFWGGVPREEALRILKDADVLVHPSLHDSGGWVCVEAMAASKPVICLDTGGPATQVTSDCGFVVTVNSVEDSVAGMATAMRELADAGTRKRLGAGGRERVRLFLWDERARFFSDLYERLVRGGDR